MLLIHCTNCTTEFINLSRYFFGVPCFRYFQSGSLSKVEFTESKVIFLTFSTFTSCSLALKQKVIIFVHYIYLIKLKETFTHINVLSRLSSNTVIIIPIITNIIILLINTPTAVWAWMSSHWYEIVFDELLWSLCGYYIYMRVCVFEWHWILMLVELLFEWWEIEGALGYTGEGIEFKIEKLLLL